MSTKNYNKGFTLVELLVVIAIIGVLSSVVLVSLNSARAKARDAKRVADLANLRLALEGYYDGNYGTDGNGADAGYEYPSTLADMTEPGVNIISTEPKDPSTAASYSYNSSSCSPANQSYIIRAALETTDTNYIALVNDVDGIVCTIDCADAPSRFYCVGP